MKRYQVFLENPDGSGKGQLYEAQTLEQVWSWLDLTFSGDDVAQLWWAKDREEKMAASAMHSEKSWMINFSSSVEYISYLFEKHGWII